MRYLALAWAAAHALQHPGARRRRATPCAALSAADEFVVKVGVVDALRGVAYTDEDDVVAAGVVAGVRATSAELGVELALAPKDDADAIVAACAAAARACRDALVADGTLDAACEVMVTDAAEAAAPAPAPAAEAGADAGGNPLRSDAYDPGLGNYRTGAALRGVRHVVAVSSCKGGVGKSTTCVNLAAALQRRGLRVGVCDADVHGPSLPALLGPPADATVRLAPEVGEDGRELLEPFEARGFAAMSFGYLNDAPAYMRGSRLAGVVQQLCASVAWRRLDVLLVDCPPGTGDAQLTLAQVLDFDGAVVVTTPSPLAFADVVKGIALFDEVDVPVVGVVENMGSVADARGGAKAAAFAARHGLSAAAAAELAALLEAPLDLFGASSARKLRDMWGIEDVVEVPLLPALGPTPVGLAGPREAPAERAALAAYDDLARHLMEFLARGRPAPPAVEFDGAAFVVGHANRTTRLAPLDLYRRCRCALCVDENSGRARSRPPPPADVVPLTLKRTGNYALAVGWSDGHQSLFPYRAFVPGYGDGTAAGAPD